MRTVTGSEIFERIKKNYERTKLEDESAQTLLNYGVRMNCLQLTVKKKLHKAR